MLMTILLHRFNRICLSDIICTNKESFTCILVMQSFNVIFWILYWEDVLFILSQTMSYLAYIDIQIRKESSWLLWCNLSFSLNTKDTMCLIEKKYDYKNFTIMHLVKFLYTVLETTEKKTDLRKQTSNQHFRKKNLTFFISPLMHQSICILFYSRLTQRQFLRSRRVRSCIAVLQAASSGDHLAVGSPSGSQRNPWSQRQLK